VAVGELATRDFIRSEISRLTEEAGEDAEKREKKAKKRRDRSPSPFAMQPSTMVEEAPPST
jgi:hypothetical protein